MTRKVTINNVKLEVSKTEAKFADGLRLQCGRDRAIAQSGFTAWLSEATTSQAIARRCAVGKALNLKTESEC